MASLSQRYLIMPFLTASLLAVTSQANAVVTLFDGINHPDSAPVKNLKFQIDGSVHVGYRALQSGSDHGSYQRRGYDNGSRIHFSAEYQLRPQLSLLGYYDMGFDVFNILHWKGHYNHNGKSVYTRQLYAGIKSEPYGTLTYGKQYSVYYDLVGVKTDIWNNDMHGQAYGNGADGDYDGSLHALDSLKYQNVFGPLTFMASILTPTDTHYFPNGNAEPLHYKRNFGGAIGVDYALTHDLKLSGVYSFTRSKVNEAGKLGHNYNQQMAGAAISWNHGPWILAASGTFYKNFVPCRDLHIVPANYFEGSAHGWEYYAGYNFPINSSFIQGLQPYVAGDGMRWHHYQTNHQFVGLSLHFTKHIRLEFEHTFTNTSDKQPDENWINAYYDF